MCVDMDTEEGRIYRECIRKVVLRRIENVSWSDKMTSKQVLERVKQS